MALLGAYYGSRGRDLGDFRGSGRADDIQFLPSRGNNLDKIIYSPYIHLGTHQHKVFSAGDTVWSILWPSLEPNTVPGGRDLGDFRGSGRTGDIQFSLFEPILSY